MLKNNPYLSEYIVSKSNLSPSIDNKVVANVILVSVNGNNKFKYVYALLIQLCSIRSEWNFELYITGFCKHPFKISCSVQA